jgi:CheY-like chemotaxis protein
MQDDLSAVSSSTSKAPAIPAPELKDGAYTAFLTRIRDRFLEETPLLLIAIRDELRNFVKSENKVAARAHLPVMSKTVRLLSDNASIAGFEQIARLTGAFAQFLEVLGDRPHMINPSTVRTMTHTVDFLGRLFEASIRLKTLPPPSPMVLEIDDETSICLLVCSTLQQAGLKAIAVDNPAVALNVAALNKFDLVFLDIAMPGMDGFDLCTKLRALTTNQHTPVVFVTGLPDFENRTQSVLRSGNDLIAKPFLPVELVVKALTYIYQSQLQAAQPCVETGPAPART